jgi:hypothetical protein
MALCDGFIGAVGDTPLIRLRRLSEETGCEILGKAEFMNPGGSVKDRAAKWIVQDAEQRGVLQPGGTVVEGTAGNTGIGLAHVCNARGYRCVIVMPDNQAAEKYQIIEALGAELRKVPAVPYSNPNQYQKVAGRLAQELPGAVWANQFDNTANRRAHFESTGPEIWRDTQGKIDAFCWRGWRSTSNRNPPRFASCSSIRRAARCITTSRTANSSPTAGRQSRKASEPAASPTTWRELPSTMPCASRTPKPCTSCTACCARRGCSSEAPPASTLRPR